MKLVKPPNSNDVTANGPGVYVVSTPLQLLNALEARAHFDEPPGLLIIVRSSQQADTLPALLADSDWVSVHRFDAWGGHEGSASRTAIFRARRSARQRLDRLVPELRKYKRLYLGNYNSPLFRHLANRLVDAELVLLDDGTETIAINRRRLGIDRGLGALARLKFDFWNLATGVDYSQVTELTYFSMYDLTRIRSGDGLILNSYRRLRAISESKPTGNQIFFLGQALVEEFIVTLNDYLTVLENAVTAHEGSEVVYIPQSYENKEKIEQIGRELGIPVKRFDLPIEAQFVYGEVMPRGVVSFYSTALNTCRMIFGDRLDVTAIELNDAMLLKDRDDIAAIYADMRRYTGEHFRVIEP